MKNNIAAWVVGLTFALGLGVSGMTDPAKVIGFLDIFGEWDPSLAFVMVGAISVHFFSYRIVKRRKSPFFSTKWHLPQDSSLTPSLIAGSLIFGVGWGLAGFCPGPAITTLASFGARPTVFVASMLAGMFVFRIVDKKMKFKR